MPNQHFNRTKTTGFADTGFAEFDLPESRLSGLSIISEEMKLPQRKDSMESIHLIEIESTVNESLADLAVKPMRDSLLQRMCSDE